jgi:hypothetical protein
MSLLTVCQNACYEIGLDAPTSIVGNTDDDARQLLALVNREGDYLSRRGTWQALQKEHTLALVNGTQTYALPADWRYILPDTTWDRTNQRQADNPVSPQEWQMLKGWTQVGGLTRRLRIRNNLFEFEQAIAAADDGNTVALEYVSKFWCGTDAGVAKARYTLNTDIALIDEELITQGLIWRMLRAKGLDYETAYQEYELAVNQQFGRDRGAKKLCFGTRTTPLAVNVPDGNYGL